MSEDHKSEPRTQPPIYILQEWRGNGWAEIARGDDVYDLRKMGAPLGNIGDHWKIACACGNQIAYYGCSSQAHAHA